MNTITTFAGNLTEVPELRFTNGGTPVTNLRVAVNRRVKQNDEWVDGTPTFHSVKVWGTAGENLVESLVRGDRVLVHGQVETESWADKETGENRMDFRARRTGYTQISDDDRMVLSRQQLVEADFLRPTPDAVLC